MPVTKLAISVPPDVIEEVDRAAAERGWTRSRFISMTLRAVARARRDAEISRIVDRFFADPKMANEQRDTAAAFERGMSDDGERW
jgi:hypothetical protein